MNLKSKKKAFSLIEVSIVILIVGIIIAGIVKGRGIINKSRLEIARSLTINSPISSIKGLNLWLETSLEHSISSSQSEDGSLVTIWNDNNTQSPNKLFARNDSSSISYKEVSEINNLPSLYFDGTVNSFLKLSTSDSGSIVETPLSINNGFTHFIVLKSDFTNEDRQVFYNGTYNSGFPIIEDDGYGYRISSSGKRLITFDFYGGHAEEISGDNTATKNLEILTFTYENSNSKIYLNGVQKIEFSYDIQTPTIGFYIGAHTNAAINYNWKGYISEIISFDHKLKNSDRREVEEYLGSKYGVKMSAS